MYNIIFWGGIFFLLSCEFFLCSGRINRSVNGKGLCGSGPCSRRRQRGRRPSSAPRDTSIFGMHPSPRGRPPHQIIQFSRAFPENSIFWLGFRFDSVKLLPASIFNIPDRKKRASLFAVGVAPRENAVVRLGLIKRIIAGRERRVRALREREVSRECELPPLSAAEGCTADRLRGGSQYQNSIKETESFLPPPPEPAATRASPPHCELMAATADSAIAALRVSAAPANRRATLPVAMASLRQRLALSVTGEIRLRVCRISKSNPGQRLMTSPPLLRRVRV